jgi:branched-chain amino acid transport system ATP-binding protein
MDTPLLETRGLSAGYGGVAVVRDLDLQVYAGQVVALLGANGAGKTTTMLTIAGELHPIGGTVHYQGKQTTAPLYKKARQGVRFVTEERSVFMKMTVRDNLRLLHRKDFEPCLEMFPELRPLLNRRAGVLSGGEQQILTMARAVAGQSTMLLADELSLGLSPMVTERLLQAARNAANDGRGVLIVEQQVARAMGVADYVYVLRQGRVVLQGSRAEMSSRWDEVRAAYFSEESRDEQPPPSATGTTDESDLTS